MPEEIVSCYPISPELQLMNLAAEISETLEVVEEIEREIQALRAGLDAEL